MNNVLIHIPHNSFSIPDKYRDLFYLSDKDLLKEQLKMTDSFTAELFDIKGIKKIVFPVSRLVCDVERFRNEADEEMAKQGMWVCYTKTSALKPLKRVTENHKQEVLERYYDKHHRQFERMVEESLNQYGKSIITDAHSFSSVSLPYELHSQGLRPDICIGTDSFHTPKELTEYIFNAFSSMGYNVAINSPFMGTIVPLKFYGKDKRVVSIMLEINRALYMNETTGKKSSNFNTIKRDIFKIITGFRF